MKYFYLLTLVILISSCGVLKQGENEKITVIVIDKKNMLPIDSAVIHLVSVKKNIEVFKEIYYSDIHGKCTFSMPNSNHYCIKVRKQGYIRYLSPNDTINNNFCTEISKKTDEELVFLSPLNTSKQSKFLNERRPEYGPGYLMDMMKVNKSMHELTWGDIPLLLESGKDTTIINGYARNPISSMSPVGKSLGVVSLWKIEIIRLTAKQGDFNTFPRYPSQTPTLGHSGEFPYSDKELMNQAYFAYFSWWQKVKYMDKKDASKIEPLIDSKVFWTQD